MISLRLAPLGALMLFSAAAPSCMLLEPNVWVEETDRIVIDAEQLGGLALTTHNGTVNVRGEEGRDDIEITIHKSAGGQDELDAQRALEAIELLTETQGSFQDVRWRWNPSRQSGWGAKVAYEVVMPAHLALRAKTHNGGIEIGDIQGETELETHNGRLSVRGDRLAFLRGETHNGRIEVAAPLERLELVTHNGRVEVDLLGSDRVGGTIRSHNGRITLRADEDISARFHCRTHNGGFTVKLPGSVEKDGKHSLVAVSGGGGETLDIETHNGSVSLLSNRRVD
ncbi:MAG: hypothetical protein RL885_19050 [Planctomycetota bacterium]